MLLLACAATVVSSALAQAPDGADRPSAVQSRYPLRLHVLAIDDTHRTVRMQPNWCSSAAVASLSGSVGGGELDPCSSGGTAVLGGGEDDFAGSGQGDLVATPGGETHAVSFTYEGCSRVRVPPGFQGLPARWKSATRLEVLLPTDRIAHEGRSAPVERCTITITTHPWVLLRMRNGALLRVAPEAFARKPSLRVFLSGPPETLQQRPPTVSVQQLASPRPTHP